MKKNIRSKYLNELISLKDTPDIKVITGIRRSGKSVLLNDYTEYIITNDTAYNALILFFLSVITDKNYQKAKSVGYNRQK